MTAEERRGELIVAAIAVMSRNGVAHTTTRSIVAEAGMQIGVFHYCFRSKGELMQEVMRTINEDSFAGVGDVLAKGQDPSELIRNVVDAYWSHVRAKPQQHQLAFELTHYALRQPGEEAAVKAQYAQYRGVIEGFLRTVGGVGGVTWRSPLDVLSRLVLAILEGVAIQWLVDHDDAMARKLLDELVAWLHREAGLTGAG
jgi:AcrR family transcriptional regulator